jgi:cytochrome c553
MKKSTLIGLIGLGLTLSGATAADYNDAAKMKANWKTHCYSCHGSDGKGKTKAGRKAKVQDLTDSKVQALYTDAQLLDQLKNGMKSTSGAELMKPYSDKMSEAEMKDLVAFVRTLGK